MIKNYFKIAFRNIKRYSTYSILNISGMAIGMASAILILLYVQEEWSYDRHFKNADNIYRVIENQNPSAGASSLFAVSPGELTKTLREEYPEIIRSSRYEPHSELRLKKGDVFMHETAVATVDKDFLKMFDIEFVQGDINSALNDPHNVVLTEEMAHKYFGNEDALGKTLLESLGYLVTVTGVIKKPQKSHLSFDFLIPVELLKERGVPVNDWQFLCYNYIELSRGTDGKLLDNKIRDFLKKRIKGSDSEIFLQNIKKIHLFSSRKYTYDISGHGDITSVRILSLIAVFILLIACINYMNLSIAQSVRRSREIGVRKVAGASNSKIIAQFLGESLLIVLVAHIIAMILVELLLPGYKNLIGKPLTVNYQSAGLYLGLIIMVLFCGLAAGSYPAFYLSSLKPLATMKGVINKNPGNTRFRRILVIFQFSISILLIICTVIVGKQLSYMQNMNLGFNKDNIGYFQFPSAPWDPKLKSLKKELLNNPDIESVTKIFINYSNPLNIEGTSGGYKWEGKKEGEDVLFYTLGADEDYAKTFQLEIKEGRYFSSDFSTDNTAIVINEQAEKVLGFKESIGKKITTAQGSELRIIGVVKDFHFKSLHYKIEPLIMQIGTANTFFIRMKPGHITSTVESASKTYDSFKPDIPMDFHFLDDDYDNLYRTEKRIGKIFGYFSLLAIIISCLGLIGLSSFMTVRRTKEIGIRKINGARSLEIFSMLSGEYVIWVLISILLACPVAWYAMHKWLQNFAYRINTDWWIFVMAGIIALIIALLTVSFQSFRAANKNPVEALRYE
jgi:ABC-type antimicrobial peptide transport system permease subunit